MQRQELEREWNDRLIEGWDWYSIYNWKRTKCLGYTKWICELLCDQFEKIELITDGLRRDGFSRLKHKEGRATLRHPNKETKEKMFCRAVFNRKEVEVLGEAVDFEVPLKGNMNAKHGDVDLLFKRDNELLCIETKWKTNKESILKAILECYVYTRLVHRVKKEFFGCYRLTDSFRLRPVVLTFESATSGRQLKNIKDYPILCKLLASLNDTLAQEDIKNIEFYLAALSPMAAEPWERKSPIGDSYRIEFKEGIKLSTNPVVVELK